MKLSEPVFASLRNRHPNHPDSEDSSPIIKPLIDLTRVRRWISTCIDGHEECRAGFEVGLSPYLDVPQLGLFRVIDVIDECIIETKLPWRYLALSYVWGGVPNFRLTTNNRLLMMRPGAFRNIWERLPRTIQDTIELVKGLHERYLWIDSLSLLQNDKTDMENGIRVMDIIYEKAVLTIIAASGSHADCGLPGVKGSSRYATQHIEQIRPGIKLACYSEIDYLLQKTLYSRRAWTFQEEIISHRKLYFVDNQVYFRCRHSTWSENTIDCTIDPSRASLTGNNKYISSSRLSSASQLDNPIEDYFFLIMYYSERALSDQRDAMSAMAGIIRRASMKRKCSFFQGIPVTAFDAFLIFSGWASSLRRRKAFPSYSWAGWIGKLSISMGRNMSDLESWIRGRKWIIWYKRSNAGTINTVCEMIAHEDFHNANAEDVYYRADLRLEDRHDLGFSIPRTNPTETLNFSRSIPEYPMLQFWTLAVYFTIDKFNIFEARASILDKSN